MSQKTRRVTSNREIPTPLTLSEWVNAGRCPQEALHEAERLFIDLLFADVRAELSTDLRWAGAEHYRRELRLEVNADSIRLWRFARPLTAIGDDDANAGTEIRDDDADWWNSMPIAERPIPADWDDIPPPDRVIKNALLLEELVDLWNATPEDERPKHFPLDPVVQAWKSRDSASSDLNEDAQLDGDISLEDYMPDWQRYRHDVRQAIEEDTKDKNGQDVHSVLDRARAAIEKHGELRSQEKVDLLVGLLRAADCEHEAPCSDAKGARAMIEALIKQLGRLGDLEHGRVRSALGRKKYPKDLLRMYYNVRQGKAGGV